MGANSRLKDSYQSYLHWFTTLSRECRERIYEQCVREELISYDWWLANIIGMRERQHDKMNDGRTWYEAFKDRMYRDDWPMINDAVAGKVEKGDRSQAEKVLSKEDMDRLNSILDRHIERVHDDLLFNHGISIDVDGNYRKCGSDVFASIHCSVRDLYRIGAIDDEQMKEYDEGCLLKVGVDTQENIRQRMMDIARGKRKPKKDDPKIWLDKEGTALRKMGDEFIAAWKKAERERMENITDDEIIKSAETDPDNPILTDEELKTFKRVSDKK